MGAVRTEYTAAGKDTEKNPVLPMSIGETFDATAMEYKEKYRMYFGWRTVRSIAMTESRDGIHWTKPVIWYFSGSVVRMAAGGQPADCSGKDGTFHMWFNGQKLGGLG